MTVRPFAAGVQLNQFLGHLLGSGAHLLAGLGPLGPAQAAELDILRIPRARCSGKGRSSWVTGTYSTIFFIVLNAQVVFGNALNRHSLDARIPANTVVLVHHQIARRDLGQGCSGHLWPFYAFSSGSWFRQRHGLSVKHTWQTEIRTQRKGAPPEPAPARQRGAAAASVVTRMPLSRRSRARPAAARSVPASRVTYNRHRTAVSNPPAARRLRHSRQAGCEPGR